MNLGAFAVVAFLRNAIGSEEIADYAGLVRRSPGLAILFAISVQPGRPAAAGRLCRQVHHLRLAVRRRAAELLTVLVIGGLNTVVSLFYYLRIVKVMALEPEPHERPAPQIPLWSPTGLYSLIITSPLLILGIWWGGLYHWAWAAAHWMLL